MGFQWSKQTSFVAQILEKLQGDGVSEGRLTTNQVGVFGQALHFEEDVAGDTHPALQPAFAEDTECGPVHR